MLVNSQRIGVPSSLYVSCTRDHVATHSGNRSCLRCQYSVRLVDLNYLGTISWWDVGAVMLQSKWCTRAVRKLVPTSCSTAVLVYSDLGRGARRGGPKSMNRCAAGQHLNLLLILQLFWSCEAPEKQPVHILAQCCL